MRYLGKCARGAVVIVCLRFFEREAQNWQKNNCAPYPHVCACHSQIEKFFILYLNYSMKNGPKKKENIQEQMWAHYAHTHRKAKDKKVQFDFKWGEKNSVLYVLMIRATKLIILCINLFWSAKMIVRNIHTHTLRKGAYL